MEKCDVSDVGDLLCVMLILGQSEMKIGDEDYIWSLWNFKTLKEIPSPFFVRKFLIRLKTYFT